MAHRMTKDVHLHDKSAEHVYRLHHGLHPLTGDELPGVDAADDECGCAHCVSYVEDDEKILADAKTAYAADPKAASKKTSKRRVA